MVLFGVVSALLCRGDRRYCMDALHQVRYPAGRVRPISEPIPSRDTPSLFGNGRGPPGGLPQGSSRASLRRACFRFNSML